MIMPALTLGLLLHVMYWTVVGGFGVLALIMGYMLLPGRLQLLGSPRILPKGQAHKERDASHAFLRPSAERTVAPLRETQGRLREMEDARRVRGTSRDGDGSGDEPSD